METVSISQLKARLSHFLREVRRGGEVQILVRGVPVARLVAVTGSGDSDDETRHALVRRGVLRAGTGDVRWLLDGPVIRTEGIDLTGALVNDREDRV